MLSVRFLDSETPPCPQINTLLMVMKAIARDLRCMRSLHTPQPQQLSRRLIHFRQKPVTLLYQHGRAIAPIHNSSSFVTSILSATPKRYYASDSLPVQTGDDSSKTVKANASVDGQPDQPGQPNHNDKDQVPAYDLTFTCKKCLSRSTHRVSKQGFYKGTVLITCPGCKNRHLISDHLKIFSDKPVTIEDLMRDKGQLVRKGNLNSDGDVEFWDTESVGTNEIRNKPME